MRIQKVRKHRGDAPDGQFYDPAPGDPVELQKPCPICPADVGEWCGSLGDIHEERKG